MNRLPQWNDEAHDPLNNVLTENRLAQEKLLGWLFLLVVVVVAVASLRPNRIQ